MAFNRVSISSSLSEASFKEQVVAAAMYEPKRSMSNSRLAGTFLSLIFGLGICYSSFFYVPAYFDSEQVLGGASHETVTLDDGEKDTRGMFTAYLDVFKLRRGYIKAGQTLRVDYTLSADTALDLVIKHCKAPVIVEVFYCQSTSDQSVQVEQTGKGYKTFLMRQPGFYYLDQNVKNLDGTDAVKPYEVVWSRTTLSPAK